jgi:Spy/CpxP family protein refolding chaperone
MNIPRLLPALAVAAALLSAPALAQTTSASPAPAAAPAQPAMHHHSPMRAALASLDLSDAQKAQLKSIYEQAKTARENGQPISHADLLKQINAVLTPDQRTQFQAALEKARAAQQQAQPQQ